MVRLGRRTDSSGLNHVADGESLDRLVLGGASRAVGAADGLDVAAALLVTSAVKREKELVSLSSFHWNSPKKYFDFRRGVQCPFHQIAIEQRKRHLNAPDQIVGRGKSLTSTPSS